jgi:8-oxo-dGTP diphosphatase
MSLSHSLNPHVSVDCVIFGFSQDTLRLLLIKRNIPNRLTEMNDILYALPGDLVKDSENLNQAADRVLAELTGLKNIYLQQFSAFGDPTRITKAKDRAWLESVRQDPDARVITVAYMSLIDSAKATLQPGSFSEEAVWMPIEEVPELAFDHNEIFEQALAALKESIQMQPIGFELLPEKFTMSDLQSLYETILDRDLDKRNFRRKMINSGVIQALSEKQIGVSNKPARFYRFNREYLEERGSNIVNLRMDGSFTLFN